MAAASCHCKRRCFMWVPKPDELRTCGDTSQIWQLSTTWRTSLTQQFKSEHHKMLKKSAGSSRIYRCTMNHTTSRMITEVAMAMTSHIAAIVGKGVSLRGFTVSQDHCHDSKLSLSNHIKPYQSISIHQTPSNAFKRVQGPWTLAVKVPESFCHRSSGFEALRPLESGARSDFLEHSLCYLAWWQAASSIKPVI
jgi:hypothetical protein